MFKEIGKSTTEWAIKNAPTILTAVGAAGVVLTAMSAGKAAIKAKEKLDEMPEDTDIKEKAKVIAPIMARPFLLGAATLFCIFASNHEHLKREGAIAAAYTLSSKAFEEYEQKVVGTIGESKNKKIKDAIAEEHVNSDPPTNEVLENDDSDKMICYDDLNGRYFKASAEQINAAVSKMNDILTSEGFVSLNEWYQMLGLSGVKHGESLGWVYEQKGDELFHLEPPWQQTSMLYQDKYPVRIISFTVEPKEYYDE